MIDDEKAKEQAAYILELLEENKDNIEGWDLFDNRTKLSKKFGDNLHIVIGNQRDYVGQPTYYSLAVIRMNDVKDQNKEVLFRAYSDSTNLEKKKQEFTDSPVVSCNSNQIKNIFDHLENKMERAGEAKIKVTKGLENIVQKREVGLSR